MMKKLVLLGAFVGACASVPILYQSNPEGFETLLRSAMEETPEPEPARPTVIVSRAEIDREPEILLGRKVRLPPDARGHFYADFKLNGRRTDALVDTGATLVAINRRTAQQIGLDLKESDFRHRVQTANGETRAAAAVIGAMQIGRIHVRDVQAVVLDDRALDKTLIGMSFLNRLSRYRVENGSLYLEQ